MIEFNGLGRPSPEVPDASILLLVQGNKVSVVRLELVPPDQFGPKLDHALNPDELAPSARAAVQTAFPEGLPNDRHWIVECPAEIAERAVFRSVSFSFGRLFVPVDEDPAARPAIGESLTEDNNHIHGWLELRINGRPLPRMGFRGVQDVCFNTWIAELRKAIAALENAPDAAHVFDEGEQGAPAFRFRRDGATLWVSVERSALSGAPGEETWSEEACQFEHFRSETERFLRVFRAEIERALRGARAAAWWASVAGPSGS